MPVVNPITAKNVIYNPPGIGAVQSTEQIKWFARGVDVTDYGAIADGTGVTGVGTDNLAAFTAAYNQAIFSGKRIIFIPSAPPGKCYRLSNTFHMTDSVGMIGAGMEPYVGASITPNATRGAGSWLYFDHSGQGVVIDGNATNASGGELLNVGFISNQPASAPGWTPAANDYNLVILGADWYIDNICFWNATNGLHHDFAGYGRLRIGYIYGDVYASGLLINRCQDLLRIGGIHWWPYSGIDANRATYKLANFVGITSVRCDGAMLQDYFCIGAKTGLLIAGDANGTTTHFMIDKCYIDLFGQYAVYIDVSATNSRVEISTLITQGAQAGDGNPTGALGGIVNAADNAIVKVGQAQINRVNNQAITTSGNNSRVYVDQLSLEDWNYTGGGATALDIAGTGAIYIGDVIASVNTVTPGSLVIPTSNVQISCYEYCNENQIVSSSIGAITSYVCNIERSRKANQVFLDVDIQITNNGTGLGVVNCALTIPGRAGREYFITGKETAISGKQLLGEVNTNTLTITNYDGTYPAVTGARLKLTGFYASNPF